MSHVATVDLEIKDLDALDGACKRLGLELVRGQQTYRWWGRHVGDYPVPAGFTKEDLGRCEHAIRIPNDQSAYEIGIVRRRDGKPGYALMWDFFAGGMGMQKHVGEGCAKLKQAYALSIATRTAQRNGFRVTEQQGPNGTVVLRCTK
jgi:hypothetical protein